MIKESTALVLNTFPIGEADKLVICLTRDYGLIRGVAKGARKLKTRFSGSLEIFSEVKAVFFKKEERELVSFSSIELHKSYLNLVSKPDLFPFFCYFAEIILEFTPEWNKDENLYKMVKALLETAQSNPENINEIAFYFEFWTLTLSGYMPSLKICSSCRRKVENFTGASLSEFLCENCFISKKGIFHFDKKLNEIFFKARSMTPSDFVSFVTKEKLEKTIPRGRNVLKSFISTALEKQIKIRGVTDE